MTERHTYATRAEAEADTRFSADPLGSIFAMLFGLAFAAGCLMVGLAL